VVGNTIDVFGPINEIFELLGINCLLLLFGAGFVDAVLFLLLRLRTLHFIAGAWPPRLGDKNIIVFGLWI
jgi:hypothetical protein